MNWAPSICFLAYDVMITSVRVGNKVGQGIETVLGMLSSSVVSVQGWKISTVSGP